MKYTGINIGPIIPTISMGRRPREIWAASYLFSFLMQCFIEEIKNIEGAEIVSPATLENNEKVGVGLYPDRVFVQGEFDVATIIDKALEKFEFLTGIKKEYVNVMYATIEEKNGESPVKQLNRLLDTTELCNRPIDEESRNSVIDILTKGYESPLHVHAFNKLEYHIPFLAEIATTRLSGEEKWTELCKIFSKIKTNKEATQKEDEFYQSIKEQFKNGIYGKDEKFFSYYKYICIVQADGDNMGKIVSSINADDVKDISQSLLNYGKAVCKIIKEYGGLPIYAGGDDLLFIAPVRAKDATIFDLIDSIDELYKDTVDAKIKDSLRPNGIHTYLSYGLSITYYKYPLYEAFKDAIRLLFEKAKNVEGKNAISWQLRKHSGTGFVGEFTKDLSSSNTIYSLFKDISKIPVEEKQISALAHKLKINEGLLSILFKKYKDNATELSGRIDNFYEKFMEDTGKDRYIKLTKELLYAMMIDSKATGIATILENMYGILRTAKFIKGEVDKNE